MSSAPSKAGAVGNCRYIQFVFNSILRKRVAARSARGAISKSSLGQRPRNSNRHANKR